MLNTDYKDMLNALLREEVDFLLVGAYAMAAHGLPRATGDIDIYVRPAPENSRKVYKALQGFGAPLHDVTPETFQQPGMIYQIGVSPNRIDLPSSIDGVSFKQAWPRRQEVEVEGVKIPVLSVEDMILNKTATGRPKDKVDADWLRSHYPR